MIASVYSTLTGKLVGKHPTLGVLVSDDGTVKLSTGWRPGIKTRKGYFRVKIHGKLYFVHRIVAETFIPNPENKPTVDHINRDPSNNSAKNLRWATYKEQWRNTSRWDNAKTHGNAERCRLWLQEKKKDPEWVKKEKERLRLKTKRENADPVIREHKNELRRINRAKKKAEQSAQPSV